MSYIRGNRVYLVSLAAVRHTVQDLLPACHKPSHLYVSIAKGKLKEQLRMYFV